MQKYIGYRTFRNMQYMCSVYVVYIIVIYSNTTLLSELDNLRGESGRHCTDDCGSKKSFKSVSQDERREEYL